MGEEGNGVRGWEGRKGETPAPQYFALEPSVSVRSITSGAVRGGEHATP